MHEEVGAALRRKGTDVMRETIDLNGTWWCTPDPETKGKRRGYHEPGFDYLDLAWRHGSRMWREVTVPCTYTNCGPDMRRMEGTAWFRRSFHVPRAWRRKRVAARFEALNFVSRIWVNGRHVMTHPDGLLRVEVPIDHALVYGEENTIVISTDNTQHYDDRSPGMDTGYYLGGGIAGNASLVVTDPTYIETVRFMHAEPAPGGKGSSALRVRVKNTRKSPVRGALRVVIRDSKGKQRDRFEHDLGRLDGESTVQATLRRTAPKINPWSPDHPNLYTAEVTALLKGKAVDAVTERFGFRKIEARGDRLFLNGKPLYLRGINYHDDTGFHPADSLHESEVAWDEAALRRDLKLIKSLGVNFVRLPHAPRIAPKLDLFDEMGLLVPEENNLHWWQQIHRKGRPWDGFRATQTHIDKIARATHRQLRKMIERDRNHPCVIIWSMSNECPPTQPGVLDTIRESLRIAQRLDRSRLAAHVVAEWHSDYGEDDFSLDDVICINGYTREHEWWDRELAKLKARYPDKPIVQTEVGSGSDIDDTQALILGNLLKWIGDNPIFSGLTIYDFACVPAQEGSRAEVTSGAYAERERRQGKRLRLPDKAYGLFTRDRRPRKSVALVRRFMERKRRQHG